MNKPATPSEVPAPCKAAGRPRAAELEARHQNLLATAGRLFLERGYSKVSLEIIAREAHVAVRTIYVKFGGKPGLLSAVLIANRNRYFSDISEIENDPRPLRTVLDEFGERIFKLITSPEALAMQRMVIAEATSNPELAQTFNDAGPRQTRAMLARYFACPAAQAQLRADVAPELLPTHLLNCVVGDQFQRLIASHGAPAPQEEPEALRQRMELFYRSVLRQP